MPRELKRSSLTLRVAETGQVNGDQMGVLGKLVPHRLEAVEALRPGAEQQGIDVTIARTFRVADRQAVDRPRFGSLSSRSEATDMGGLSFVRPGSSPTRS